MAKVLITGAANGIGLATAEEFAKAGHELILVDIDVVGLKNAATHIRSLGAKTTWHDGDVSSLRDAEEIHAAVGPIDILINNAGVGHNGEISDMKISDWQRLIRINLYGPINYISTFLPGMIEGGSGHIVNVSSGQAFFKLPGWGAYAAVKSAVGVLSEVLAIELRKHNVQVTTVYPFMVDTGFHKCTKPTTFMSKMSVKFLPLYSDTPEKVAEIILKAVQDRKRVEDVNIINTLGRYLNVFPFMYNITASIANRFMV